MDMQEEKSATIASESNRRAVKYELCRPASPRLDAVSFVREWGDGNFFVEADDDIGVYILRLPYREIIPIAPPDKLPLPPSVRRKLSSDKFDVSTDVMFDEVVAQCAAARPGQEAKDTWLRGRLQALLKETYKAGHAHSIEIWCDGELAGGALGIHIGAVYISLSTFTKQSGAGYAASFELNGRLHRAGFAVHDSVLPSNLSRVFGGKTVSSQDDFIERSYARNRPLKFPTEAVCFPAYKVA